MAAAAPQKKVAGKSGLRQLKPGEVLFNDGEKANSLYIIQKGQLRLFKPKGKGFIEIAVLRSGEVIGEMAYFDIDGGGKRSCAAAAMVSSDVIEISFTQFSKTMEGLNPWFKTIINTLAKRLRATNSRVKELESNSTSVNYGTGKHTGYEFLKPLDIIKVLGTLFLVYKAHGEEGDGGLAIHRRTLDLYSHDIFGIIESKLDAVIFLLEELGLGSIEEDKDGLPKILVITDLNILRSFFIFFNTERHLTDDKKLVIGKKCQTFLEAIWDTLHGMDIQNDGSTLVPIQENLNYWKERNLGIIVEHLDDAREQGIVGEVIVGANNDLSVEVDAVKLEKLLPTIKFLNAIKDLNDKKQEGGG
jgi:CRP/FNR family cyclic AMP-dependent transcriptional regulator